jgi:hypothetical protein
MTYTPVKTQTFTETYTATVTLTLTLIDTATATFTGTYIPTPEKTATITQSMEIDGVYVFPNPFPAGGGDLNIGFDVTRPADMITIAVYTPAFRKVMETSVSGSYPGAGTATFKAREFGRLANGVYYVEVRAGAGSVRAFSKPVVLIILW